MDEIYCDSLIASVILQINHLIDTLLQYVFLFLFTGRPEIIWGPWLPWSFKSLLSSVEVSKACIHFNFFVLDQFTQARQRVKAFPFLLVLYLLLILPHTAQENVAAWQTLDSSMIGSQWMGGGNQTVSSKLEGQESTYKTGRFSCRTRWVATLSPKSLSIA